MQETDATPSQPPRRRRCLVNLGLMLFSVIFTLILMELGIRLVFIRTLRIESGVVDTYEQLYIPYDTYIYGLNPGYDGKYTGAEFSTDMKINSHGLRDREYDYEKPDNVFRILILGDSFMMGAEVEEADTMASVLETTLNTDPRTANSDYTFEVINSAVSGYNTLHAYMFLREEGLKYSPDLVLYALMYNDTVGLIDDSIILDDKSIYADADADGNLRLSEDGEPILIEVNIPPGELPSSLPMSERLDRRLQVSQLYYRVLRPVLARTRPILRTTLNRTLNTNLPVFVEVEYTINPENPAFPARWSAIEQLTLLMQDRAAEQNACLTSIVVPDMLRVYPHIAQEYYIGYNAASVHWQADKFDTLAANHYTDNGIPYLLISDIFMPRAAEGEQLQFPMDRHWNEHGHEVAAEAVYEWLIESELIPTTDQPTYQQCGP